MDKFRIHGGERLAGVVRIAGAKNAALPCLAAPLLTAGAVTFTRVPALRDVRTMLRVVEHLGATTTGPDEGRVRVECREIASCDAPYDLVKTMRASVVVLGPLLARYGRARVSLPGGCAIGERPIDLHLRALEALGATIELEHGYVDAKADRLRGADHTFAIPTVTGTENVMMAATLARGTTVLRNCACEPEIVDLAMLLNAMGASVEGAGTDTIVIEGRDRLLAAEHAVIPDRIEAGTFLLAGPITGGRVRVEGCEPGHLAAVLRTLEDAGVRVEVEGDAITTEAPGGIDGIDVRTAPYPGFPTDMQAQLMALMTRARGASAITETIFEQRFMHVAELRRLGADIRVDGRCARVYGPSELAGAQVMATDLRASASLVLAGLAASGVTVVDRVYHLDRGYEPMERKLASIGARVERVR